jgi:hypothetical protein
MVWRCSSMGVKREYVDYRKSVIALWKDEPPDMWSFSIISDMATALEIDRGRSYKSRKAALTRAKNLLDIWIASANISEYRRRIYGSA